MSALTKFRTFRASIAADGVKPVGFLEWYLGRLAGDLLVTTATMAKKRGDDSGLNHAILAIWAGNRTRGGQLAARMTPAELSQARRDGRLRLVVDPYISPQA